MHLFVGSKNPVKLNAVITAASETWPDVIVEGHDVPSGVGVQPRSDVETRTGARNRALAALDEGIQNLERHKQNFKHSEVLGVGLEGGVFEMLPQENQETEKADKNSAQLSLKTTREPELWSTVWVAVVDADGNFYESSGARFKVPSVIAERIRKGEEMGPVVNAVIGQGDVRHSIGMIGVITARFIDRTEEYSGIAKMALGLWYGREWNKHLR